MTCGDEVTPFAAASERSVSIEMPSQTVSNLDHFVTQWMSFVVVWRGSAVNSSHVHRALRPSAALTVKSQAASGVRGVGPAERTGKSRVSYWPGGSRPAVSADCRLPRNPREINAIGAMSLSERQNQSYDRFVNVANFVQVEVADYSSKSCIANNLVITKTRDCFARCFA